MIADHAVHACAWLAVRCLPWRATVPTMRVLGRVVPPLADETRARRSLRTLRGGTCLTRSLATAARLRGSQVALGVRRDKGTFLAHAWVMVAGAPLERGDSVGAVITTVDLWPASR